MKYGLLGAKLGHSFSKEIHESFAGYSYDLLELNEEELTEFLNNKDFCAVNVTIPYKKTVIPFLHSMTDAAKMIGAVNCIRNDNGKLIGHNTDFDGIVCMIKKSGVEISGKKVLVLGTGGTSNTAFAVLKYLGAKTIIKVSRTESDIAVSYETAKQKHSDAQIIFNTTPVGMYPDIYNCPINLDSFENLEAVFDAVYNPLKTSLSLEAQKRNIVNECGLAMLVGQAVKASEFFLNTKYSDETFNSVYKNIHFSKMNIVLIGMPACGKSTIGKNISKKLNRKFVDTDKLIVKKAGMPIPEIFNQFGEKHFRDLESEVIKQVSKECGIVIATGGGAVLRSENVNALKHNGKLCFLDRDLDCILPTSDRPTASDKEAIKKRYHERYDIYKASADFTVHFRNNGRKAAERILEVLK